MCIPWPTLSLLAFAKERITGIWITSLYINFVTDFFAILIKLVSGLWEACACLTNPLNRSVVCLHAFSAFRWHFHKTFVRWRPLGSDLNGFSQTVFAKLRRDKKRRRGLRPFFHGRSSQAGSGGASEPKARSRPSVSLPRAAVWGACIVCCHAHCNSCFIANQYKCISTEHCVFLECAIKRIVQRN